MCLPVLCGGVRGSLGRPVRDRLSQLFIGAEKILEDLRVGDSITVNGVHLTAVRFAACEITTGVMWKQWSEPTSAR